MSPKFPALRSDGSFSLELIFHTEEAVDYARVVAWLSTWSTANYEWIREWRGAMHQVVKTDVLLWSRTFSRRPNVAVVTDDSVIIRLDVMPGAAFWKDWMVKLVEETVAKFDCLVFTEAKNVD